MIDISLNNIKMNYGFGDILNGISFDIKSGEKVALIGTNGCGKTTLLKLIMGIEKTTSGIISKRKGITIGYLEQATILRDDDCKVSDLLYESLGEILDIEKRLKKYEEKMLTTNSKELDKIILKYTNLQDQYIKLGGYEVNEKIGRIVKGFKIESLLDLNYNNLSGGEKRIVSFASLMIKNPDVLLLDEPTNHLDINTLEWLENYLKEYKGTVILVSHDRYFIDKVTNKIIQIENGDINIYFGNYSNFIEENEKRIMLEFKDYNDQQKQIKAMKESIKKLRDFGKLGDNERFFRRAKAIEKRLEKMEKINKPKIQKEIPLEFNMIDRSGKDVLSIKNLSIKFEDKEIFNDINININYKDKICLMGKNGSGKSTLIKYILNENENIKLGTNIKIGYIPQEITFDKNKTIYDIARQYYIGEESHLRSALFKFMFTKDNIYKKTDNISGGEKVRLKLFCLMQENINFLILDEPTNHIDITTREILEDALKDYDGTLLFVSHDRYFINNLASKLLVINDKKIIEFIGNYDDNKSKI